MRRYVRGHAHHRAQRGIEADEQENENHSQTAHAERSSYFNFSSAAGREGRPAAGDGEDRWPGLVDEPIQIQRALTRGRRLREPRAACRRIDAPSRLAVDQ